MTQTSSLLEARGTIVPFPQLQTGRAHALAHALDSHSIEYAHFVECRKTSEEEIVVFDVEVEVAQITIHDIRPRERLAVTFGSSGNVAPKVEALRQDFPSVPHVNLHRQVSPKDLCIFAESWEDVKRGWTPARFVRHLRGWLAKTAQNELHQPDQPLEPILLDYSGHLILDRDILDRKKEQGLELLYAEPAPGSDASKPFVITSKTRSSAGSAPFLVSVHRCNPQVHGTINRRPATLKDLGDLIAPTGLHIVEEIQDRLKRWKISEDGASLEAHLVLVVLFPKTRRIEGPIERVDVWSFVLMGKIRILGEKLGVWKDHDGRLGTLIVFDTTKHGDDVALDVLNTSYALDRAAAAALNDRAEADNLTFTAIGMGAIGSQIVINVSRSGLGKWNLIDYDQLMPHNLARHALFGPFVGCSKAEGVANVANTIIADQNLFSAIKANVVSPGAQAGIVAECIEKSDVIVDMSASIAVARRLACDAPGRARRVSLFLSPSGNDLVLLAEDRERIISLDALEMQYYRAVLSERDLHLHLKGRSGQQRYGQSCRDVTHILPHSLVALHAAIGAAAVQDLPNRPEALISVWRSDSARNVRRIDVPTHCVARHVTNGWTVISDEGLTAKLLALRESKLPKETGGVLLGSFDIDRHLIYICDVLPSPSDSVEWPTLYVRGSAGLQQGLVQAEESTNGMIEYIGEWHSHPRGSRTTPSGDDEKVFAWIAELMSRDGLPGVMMIVGDTGVSCFVEKLEGGENLIPKAIPIG